MDEQEREELMFRRHKEKIIKDTDQRYAVKLVERIVFGLVTLILTGVVVALITLVVK